MSEQLFHAAAKLAESVNQAADEHLPEKLAGIVKLHAKLAVAAAFIPIPIADVAAAGTNVWTMYVRINKEIDLPFADNVMKSIATGVLTNLGSGLAVCTVGSLIKTIPGVGTLAGGFAMGATVYAVTIVAGIVYMNAIAKLLDKGAVHMSEKDVDAAALAEMADKAALKRSIQAAKAEYLRSKKHD